MSEDTALLFQYGSNMDHERFMARIEDSYADHAPRGTPLLVTLLGPARLGGWNLQLNLWSATRKCRVLNIMEGNGGVVWGALYEIASPLLTRCDGKRSVIDRLEGHRTTRDPENYAKICVTVDQGGESRAAWTYIGLREAIRRCEEAHREHGCDAEYTETAIRGATAIGVPVRYLDELREKLGHA